MTEWRRGWLSLLSQREDEVRKSGCNGEDWFRGTGSRALKHHLHIPPPLSNLEWQLMAGAFRVLVVRQLQPPFCPSGCSPAEMAMRTCQTRVYISLHVSHLAKHERKALEEKLCSLPLSLQLPLILPVLWVSNNNNNNNKTKTKIILGS